VKPLPITTNLDPRKVALGRALFHEPKLSHDNTISCASCHDLRGGGADGREHSVGIHGTVGTINAPTVFNSAANFKQFWDGRAATLEEQVNGPVQSPAEMGSNWDEIVTKLQATPSFVTAFAEAYRDGIQPQNVRHAIAEFERSLITPNSRFDRFLRGDKTALTASEQEGYRKFKSHGCTSCHQGVNLGGNLFETLGAMADYFEDRGEITKADLGRYNVTGREEDRYVFKVPSLRNIALTAPYLHDGAAATLADAVSVMARYQLGERLPDEDLKQIVEFLKTLTGEYEGHPL
jgi:cytochrome c peroxidase